MLEYGFQFFEFLELKTEPIFGNCGNDIAKIGGKKKTFGIVKSGMEFGNSIATIPFHFFFFF